MRCRKTLPAQALVKKTCVSKLVSVENVRKDFLPGGKKEDEGRLMRLEFQDFIILAVYTPNSGSELARLDYRINEWDAAYR